MDEKVEKFLVFLEAELDRRNMSVPELADLIGVPHSTVYTWVNRVAIMGLDKYYKLLEVLGLEENLTVKGEK